MNDEAATKVNPAIRDFCRPIMDRIWNAGHTPRIVIDATHKDVDVPEFIRRQWGSKLVFDLQANYPLNIDFGGDALSLSMAFSGTQHRCVIPWNRIYLLIDRDTGGGIQINETPKGGAAPKVEESRPAPEAPKAPEPTKKPNPFRVIKGGKS